MGVACTEAWLTPLMLASVTAAWSLILMIGTFEIFSKFLSHSLFSCRSGYPWHRVVRHAAGNFKEELRLENSLLISREIGEQEVCIVVLFDSFEFSGCLNL